MIGTTNEAKPVRKGKIFYWAAWYSLITPLGTVTIIYLLLAARTKIDIGQSFVTTLLTGEFFVLVSSFVSGIVGFFMLIYGNWKMALVAFGGTLASAIAGYYDLVGAALSTLGSNC